MANTTGRNRWGRFKTIDRVEHKICNGSLHREGIWLPLSAYYILKRGKRIGKPMPHCIECERFRQNRRLNAGIVPIARIAFVFNEIIYRVGRYEAARRIGITPAALYQIDRKKYKNVHKVTAIRAINALRLLREDNVVRHRHSIKRGSAARGEVEKMPINRDDFNGPDDLEAARKRAERKRAA